jgi:hypothetical protein
MESPGHVLKARNEKQTNNEHALSPLARYDHNCK